MTPGINSAGHTRSKYLNNYSNGYVTQAGQYHILPYYCIKLLTNNLISTGVNEPIELKYSNDD